MSRRKKTEIASSEDEYTGPASSEPGSPEAADVADMSVDADMADAEADAADDPPADAAPAPAPEVPAKRGRGRPPGSGKKKLAPGTAAAQNAPLDEDGRPYEVRGDELVLTPDDEGEKKVNADGELQGGREFRVRTFSISGRGARLYMLSTEPARCMGFRDSYLLFQKHRFLWKVVLTDEEKFELIERSIIPHSYKGRVIGVVTARSVFREFGARIVVGGHRVTDDYYETRAREQGFTGSELADPDDPLPPPGRPYDKDQYVAWHGASQVYHQPPHLAGHHHGHPVPAAGAGSAPPHRKDVLGPPPEAPGVSWLADSAAAVARFNSALRKDRARLLDARGVYEPHTGVPFYAKNTQPARAAWRRAGAVRDDKVIVSTLLRAAPRATRTGLASIDPEVYAGADPELCRAIEQQIAAERS